MAVADLDDIATALIAELHRAEQQIVFAESCTGGLISATLSRVPGVSAVLAGSSVVYQLKTKTAWLDVDEALLNDPGPVSREVAEHMALGVLNSTPHATISASVTGHLGPHAPPELDGTAWVALARRRPDDGRPLVVAARRLTLPATTKHDGGPLTLRHARQQNAAEQVLRLCLEFV